MPTFLTTLEEFGILDKVDFAVEYGDFDQKALIKLSKQNLPMFYD